MSIKWPNQGNLDYKEDPLHLYSLKHQVMLFFFCHFLLDDFQVSVIKNFCMDPIKSRLWNENAFYLPVIFKLFEI